MALVAFLQPNKALKLFSSKLYKIRARPLDFLVQNLGPFTTPTCTQLLSVENYPSMDRISLRQKRQKSGIINQPADGMKITVFQ